MNKIYYVYTHTRLDTNKIFYVGIGTKRLNCKYKCHIYQRGYFKSPSKRSKFWMNVFKACGEKIQVDILFESSNLEEVRNKEIELIKLYGKRSENKGDLVNFTDGGEGVHGMIWSKEARQKRSELYKISNPFKNKKHTKETKKILSEINKEKYLKGKSGICNFTHHSIETKKILSKKGKERWKKGNLHLPPIMKGKDNYFSKKYLAISSDNVFYIIEGGIKNFCNEFNLSYSYVKKFKNQGKILNMNNTRIRPKSFHTLGWEFLDDANLIEERLKDCDVTIVHYKPN